MSAATVTYQKQLEERHRRNLQTSLARLREIADDIERNLAQPARLMTSPAARIAATAVDVERAVVGITTSAELLSVVKSLPDPVDGANASTGCPHSTEPGDFCSACMLPTPAPRASGRTGLCDACDLPGGDKRRGTHHGLDCSLRHRRSR